MMRLKYLLLPIAGALAAFLSFVFANPWVKTLDRGLQPSDPMAGTTFGTTWSLVQHSVFGMLLCGSFCFLLEVDRRTPRQVLKSTILGVIFGGVVNSVADSGADYIGIVFAKHSDSGAEYASQVSGLVGFAAWIILVPMALAFSVTFAIGPTGPRIHRALYATGRAGLMVALTRFATCSYASAKLSVMGAAGKTAGEKLIAGLPYFLLDAIAAGIVLGLVMAMADRSSRKGSLRLVYGHKEFKDWSLDHATNRIGSGEVEISVRGYKGVEPVHACIFNQGMQFMFDSQHFPSFINGYPVAQALLNHGDMIQIGEAQLVFYSGGPIRSQAYPMQRPPMMPAQPMHPMPTPVPVGPNAGPAPMPQVPTMPGQPIQAPYAGAPPSAVPIPAVAPVPSQPAIIQPVIAPVMDPISVAAPVPTTQYSLVDSGGKVYPLIQGVNSVGREVGNAVCFANNSTVSRSHAHIIVDDNGATVSDLRSANGTGVNGAPVTGAVALNDGDTVAFGSASLTFKAN